MAVSVHIPAAKAHATLTEVQAFQQAVEDHRFLSEYVANVRQSAALFSEPHPQRRIAALKGFLAEHVVGHFAFEEQQVFPQLLARERDPATRQAVAELADEHQSMLATVRTLRRMMRTAEASGSARSLARLEQSFRDFLHVLQVHAVKEDNILLAVKQSRRHEAPLE